MDECQEVYENVIDSFSTFSNLDFSEENVVDMTALTQLVFISRNEKEEEMEVKSLSLAYEKLRMFPMAILNIAERIQILDLSWNEFENLNFLKHFKQLTTLVCDKNNITSNCVLPELPTLEILWMNHCKIKILYPFARNLRNSCPKLKYVSLMGNEAVPSAISGSSFYDYLQYRLFMISLFPNLEYLDDKQVTAEEKTEANRLYKRPIFDKIYHHFNYTFFEKKNKNYII